MNNPPAYLNREQAAAFLHIRPKTLTNWASQGKGPKFRKPTARMVLYAIEDLQAWVNGEA